MLNKLRRRWQKSKLPTSVDNILSDDVINGNGITDDRIDDLNFETFNRNIDNLSSSKTDFIEVKEKNGNSDIFENTTNSDGKQNETQDSEPKRKSDIARAKYQKESECEKSGGRYSDEVDSRGKLKRLLSIGRKKSTLRQRSPSSRHYKQLSSDVSGLVSGAQTAATNCNEAKLNSDRELEMAVRLKQRRSLDSVDDPLSVGGTAAARPNSRGRGSNRPSALSSFRDDPSPRNIADSVSKRVPRPRHSTLDDFLNSIFLDSSRQHDDRSGFLRPATFRSSDGRSRLERSASSIADDRITQSSIHTDKWKSAAAVKSNNLCKDNGRFGNSGAVKNIMCTQSRDDECSVVVHRPFNDDMTSSSDDEDDDDDDDFAEIENLDIHAEKTNEFVKTDGKLYKDLAKDECDMDTHNKNNLVAGVCEEFRAAEPPPPPPPPPPVFPLPVSLKLRDKENGDIQTVEVKVSPPRLKRRQKTLNPAARPVPRPIVEGVNESRVVRDTSCAMPSISNIKSSGTLISSLSTEIQLADVDCEENTNETKNESQLLTSRLNVGNNIPLSVGTIENVSAGICRPPVDVSKYTYRRTSNNSSNTLTSQPTSNQPICDGVNSNVLTEHEKYSPGKPNRVSHSTSHVQLCDSVMDHRLPQGTLTATSENMSTESRNVDDTSALMRRISRPDAVITYCISPGVLHCRATDDNSIKKSASDMQESNAIDISCKNSSQQKRYLKDKEHLVKGQELEDDHTVRFSSVELSPDTCSCSDGEGRDSGYVTLEDLQAQLGSSTNSDSSSIRSSRYSGSSTGSAAFRSGSESHVSPSLASTISSASAAAEDVLGWIEDGKIGGRTGNTSKHVTDKYDKDNVTVQPANSSKEETDLIMCAPMTSLLAEKGVFNVLLSGRLVTDGVSNNPTQPGSRSDSQEQSSIRTKSKNESAAALELTFTLKLLGSAESAKLTRNLQPCLNSSEDCKDEIDASCKGILKHLANQNEVKNQDNCQTEAAAIFSSIASLNHRGEGSVSNLQLTSQITSPPVNELLPSEGIHQGKTSTVTLNKNVVVESVDTNVTCDKTIQCDCDKTIMLPSCPSTPNSVHANSLTSNSSTVTPTMGGSQRTTLRPSGTSNPGGLPYASDPDDSDDMSFDDQIKDDGSYLPPLSERSDTTSPINSRESTISKRKSLVCQRCSCELIGKHVSRSAKREASRGEEFDNISEDVEDISVDVDSVFLPTVDSHSSRISSHCCADTDRSLPRKRHCLLARSISEVRRSNMVSDVITPSSCKVLTRRRQCRSIERGSDLNRTSPHRSLSSTRFGIFSVPQKLKNWFLGGDSGRRSSSRSGSCDGRHGGYSDSCRGDTSCSRVAGCRRSGVDEESSYCPSCTSKSRLNICYGLQSCHCVPNKNHCVPKENCSLERSHLIRCKHMAYCTDDKCFRSTSYINPVLAWADPRVKRYHSMTCRESLPYQSRIGHMTDQLVSSSDSDCICTTQRSCYSDNFNGKQSSRNCYQGQDNRKDCHRRARSTVPDSSLSLGYKTRSKSSECRSLGTWSRSRCSWFIDSERGKAVLAWNDNSKVKGQRHKLFRDRNCSGSGSESASSRFCSVFNRTTDSRIFSTGTVNGELGWKSPVSPPSSPRLFQVVDPMTSSMTASSRSSGRQKASGLFSWYTTNSPRISQQNIARSLTQLHGCEWYWGPLSLSEAEAKLEGRPEGSFIVRDSSDERFLLSLSFRSLNSTHHTRIEHYNGKFCFHAQPQSLGSSTIVDFIDNTMAACRAGHCLYYLRPRGPGLSPAPVMLLHPVSRLRYMHSLQHLSKFAVLRSLDARLHLVDRLPLAPRLKEYLKLNQFGPDPPSLSETLQTR